MNIPFDVSYPYQGATVVRRTGNVSAHGFFVSTGETPPVGSTLRFSLIHSAFSHPLDVVGRVVHIRSDGMGVQIRQISAGQDEVFERYRELIESELYATDGKR